VDRTRLAQRDRDVTRLSEELDRIGLLLHHDVRLPSATTLIVGEPIRGSWWGHPRGHDIYDALSQFDEGPGALCLKLVNGKLAYVAERLWPYLLELLDAHRHQTRALPQPVERLLQMLETGPVHVGSLDAQDFGGKKQLSASVEAIGQKLLADVSRVHSESGKHVKVLASWPFWAQSHRTAPRVDFVEAKTRMNTALAQLQHGAPHAKTPLDPLLDR
jgi:hypothetical protein